MEKIQQTNQNEKFSKMQRIQKFAKEGTANKNAQNQNYPNIPPKEKEFRKTKNENKTAQTKANAEQGQKACEEASVIWGDGKCDEGRPERGR